MHETKRFYAILVVLTYEKNECLYHKTKKLINNLRFVKKL